MDESLAIESVFSKYGGSYTNLAGTSTDTDDTNSYMSFDSYLQLMVAQMQNQDFNDPMDDSEVLAQMAQYSMLEGIKTMTQQSNISYSTSLVGKVVTVDGIGGICTGKVDSVTVSNGKAQLMIDGDAYDSDKVTDIVSEEMFNNLMSLIGKTVTDKKADPETAVTGKVSNIVYYGGEGYVIVNGKEYSISDIQLVNDSADESAETVTEVSEVQTAEAAAAYSAKSTSNSAIENFIKELCDSEGVSDVSESSEIDSAFEEYISEIVELQVPDYAAGVYADGETFTDSIVPTDTYGNGTLTADNYSDYGTSAVQYTASGKLKGVTTAKGVSECDCVPHRISVEAYPEEAALADELGTRMYDIRFINNHAITSRINTDEVIGHTVSGREITEIGYSGEGQLGEVVTFADGTQRVEILLKSGKSCWVYTSGNYTLDEICVKTKDSIPGSLTGKLTPSESVIRHFSDPTEGLGESLKTQFAQQIQVSGV